MVYLWYMKNIKASFLIAFLVLVPWGSLNAALNAYLKLDGGSGGSNATNTPATETINTESAPPPGSSRDVYLDIKDIEGDSTKKAEEDTKINQKGEEGGSAAGPALLEIDTIRGESPENSSTDSSDRLRNAGPVTNWPISVSSREIRGWDAEKKQEFMVSIKTAAEVQSGQDLENFAKGILLKDENVEFVEADEENVKVTYKMPARLFGIFTASLNTRAEVMRNGTVKVALPWYSFLFKKQFVVNDIKSGLETNLPELDDEVLVLFETRAKVLTTLSTIMKTKHDTAKNSINNLR